MPDLAVAYNRYKFLGHEFLTWLWFLIEKDHEQLRAADPELSSLEIGNRIVLENNLHDSVETITIKGDDAGLEEGILAMRKGAMVTELNLSYISNDQEWRFTIKGESLNISSFKPPEVASVETKEDVEGAILEKVYLYEKALLFVDKMFKSFIRLRVSQEWREHAVPLLKNWIAS